MERPPAMTYQMCPSSLPVHSPPTLQSPRTASIAYPSPNSISASFGLPHSPEHSNYQSAMMLTSSSNAIITNRGSNPACLSLSIHSPHHSYPHHAHQGDIIHHDHSMYPSSSAMIPTHSTATDCSPYDPSLGSPTIASSCSNMAITSASAGMQGSPSSVVGTPGTPQQLGTLNHNYIMDNSWYTICIVDGEQNEHDAFAGPYTSYSACQEIKSVIY